MKFYRTKAFRDSLILFALSALATSETIDSKHWLVWTIIWSPILGYYWWRRGLRYIFKGWNKCKRCDREKTDDEMLIEDNLKASTCIACVLRHKETLRSLAIIEKKIGVIRELVDLRKAEDEMNVLYEKGRKHREGKGRSEDDEDKNEHEHI